MEDDWEHGQGDWRRELRRGLEILKSREETDTVWSPLEREISGWCWIVSSREEV